MDTTEASIYLRDKGFVFIVSLDVTFNALLAEAIGEY